MTASGQPLAVHLLDPDDGFDQWRVAAEVWALPDGGFAWADLGWGTNDTGHPSHVRPGPALAGEHGEARCGDAELLVLAPGDPDMRLWLAWQEYRAGEGKRATRELATWALNESGLLPDDTRAEVG